jgi:hypothetical protein
MLKRIPKSDISIRPFKAYKEWSFSSGSTQIDVLEADDKSTNLSGQFPKNSIYGQLRAQFYNGNEDNPFLRTGNKSNRYVDTLLSTERFLSGSAKVISIPNVYVGEGIKKGSVILKDNLNELNEISYFDDSFGNIQDNRDSIRLGKIDIENKLINFSDLSNYIYSGSLLELDPNTFDIENNILSMSYNGDSYELTIVSMDIETSVMIVEDIPFLPQESQGIKMGNVFYNQGLIVLTRNSADLLKTDWELDYKSTETIYEHEYLLIANEDEFNISQNPSAIVEVGRVNEYITGSDGKIYKTTTKPGVKYIKKKSILETGEILDYRIGSSVSQNTFAGFEHYDLSGSVDSTGSFLTPFITTIGLYDDNCDLVAVAKLPRPIKSEPDIPVNFIVRFDT